MSVEYTNRKGDVYYLHADRTPTGRPQYYCSREQSDSTLDVVPAGYEIWESPEAGLVYVRKAKPVVIPAFERQIVEDAIRLGTGLEYFLVDVQSNSLVVYLPAIDMDELTQVMGKALPTSSPVLRAKRNSIVRRSAYVKMMRFVLMDEDERLFRVERWCFRGRIDGWMFLDGPAELEKMVHKYVKHLGTERFFDLI